MFWPTGRTVQHALTNQHGVFRCFNGETLLVGLQSLLIGVPIIHRTGLKEFHRTTAYLMRNHMLYRRFSLIYIKPVNHPSYLRWWESEQHVEIWNPPFPDSSLKPIPSGNWIMNPNPHFWIIKLMVSLLLNVYGAWPAAKGTPISLRKG